MTSLASTSYRAAGAMPVNSGMPGASNNTATAASLGRVLLVDDDRSMCEALASGLSKRSFEVIWETDPSKAMGRLVNEDFDVVVSDLRMPQIDGIALCRQITEQRPDLPVVVVTAFGSFDSAIEAIRAGAYDFVTKPFELDSMALTLERASKHRHLREEVRRLRRAVDENRFSGTLVGESASMKRVYDIMSRVAETDATVLITGESGTGKERVASELHRLSKRSAGQFVAINCAAMPEALLESELFGHTKGAFTDARVSRDGLFVQANGGTLLLDEIGDMPISLQTRLLRVLQEREVVRLGSQHPIPVDLRVIAATHCNLRERIKEGSFRADLYYRLNILRVSIPPLRERPQDIGSLALKLLFASMRRQGCSLPADQALAPLMPILLRYEWPGNVRELENIMERFAAFLGTSRSIAEIDYQSFLAEAEELGETAASANLALPAPEASIAAFALRPEPTPQGAWQASHALPVPNEGPAADACDDAALAIKLDAGTISDALERSGGNKQHAAILLGVSRTTLWRRMRDEHLP